MSFGVSKVTILGIVFNKSVANSFVKPNLGQFFGVCFDVLGKITTCLKLENWYISTQIQDLFNSADVSIYLPKISIFWAKIILLSLKAIV